MHLQPLDLELADLQPADRGTIDRQPPHAEPPDRKPADRRGPDGKRPDSRRAPNLSAGSGARSNLRSKERDPASLSHPATLARTAEAYRSPEPRAGTLD